MASQMANLDARPKALVMSLSNSAESHSGEQEQQFDPAAFIDQPLIILSSEDENVSEEVKQAPEDHSGLTVVQRKHESEQQKLRRLNSVKNLYEELEQQQKRERDELRNNPPRKIHSQMNRAKEMQLRKEFPPYNHLPIEALEFVKEKLEEFNSHRKCQIEKTEGLSELQVRWRQQQRQKLTKSILFALEELKTMKDERTTSEEKLCGNEYDVLAYSYRVASDIERQFFRKLYKKKANKVGEKYNQQIKLVLKEFADKNNIAFRRGIISLTLSLSELAKETQQSLMCEKTRQQKGEKLKQLIRQNEKVEPKSPNSIDEEVVEVAFESIHAFASMKSRTEYEEKPQPVEDKRKKEISDLISKNKLICKKTYDSIRKATKEMRQRIHKLRRSGLEQVLPEQLTFQFSLRL